MWKDEYISGMMKLTVDEAWRTQTLRRMEQAVPTGRRIFSVRRVCALAGCAAALALAVLTAWPYTTQSMQTAGGSQSTVAMARQEPAEAPAPKQYAVQDTLVLQDAEPIQGTVLSWTDEKLVLDTQNGEQTFLLNEESEIEPNALTEGVAVQVNWQAGEDGTMCAVRVCLAQ